jgi:hypothetical protein
MYENIAIITRIYQDSYRVEKEILGNGRPIIGRIISIGSRSSHNLTLDDDTINISSHSGNIILCLNGDFLRNTYNRDKIEDIFKTLKIKICLCHLGGGDRDIDELKENHPWLKDYDIGTYSGEEDAKKINTMLNAILNSEQTDQSEAVNSDAVNTFYAFITKKILPLVKKKVISLWLPLAIDIQGLSEVKVKALEYWKEIRNAHLNDNGKQKKFVNLIKEHKDLTEKFDELKLNEKDENDIEKFLKNLDDSQEVLPLIKTLDNGSHFFFPEWFERWAHKF